MNIETLDDIPVLDACPGFTGGQVSNGPADEIPQNQYARGINLDINGKIAGTRRGTAKLGDFLQEGYPIQGLAWMARVGGGRLIAVSNGIVFSSPADGEFYGSGYSGVWTEIDFLSGGIAGPVSIAQLADKMYFAHPSLNLYTYDGSAITAQASGGPTNPPAGISILVTHTQRLFAAGITSQPDTIAVSDFLDGTKWDMATKSFRVGGDGDPIVALCSWVGHRLIVFKRSSIWAVDADPLVPVANWPVVRITNQLGAVATRAVAQVGADVFFLSDSGIHSIRRTVSSADADEIAPAVSDAIQDVIDRINWSAADTCSAVWWKNRFLLSVPLDGADTPTHCIVYDSLRNAWAGIWTIPATCFAVSNGGNGKKPRLNIGREDGSVRQWLDYVPAANEVESTFQDADQPIETSILSRAMIFGQPANPKDALNARVEFFDSSAIASIAVRLDESEPITIANDVATGEQGLDMPFDLPAILPGTGIKGRAFCLLHLPAFYRMQVEVSSSSGKLSLRAAIAAAFVNALEIET